jgi:putative membrane protein
VEALNMNYQLKKWLKLTLSPKGSVVPSIWLPVVISIIASSIITIWYKSGAIWLNQPALVSLIPSVVLGLLLVFRTNTSYDRFWEGRKLIGSIIINCRSLGTLLWVNIPEKNPEDTEEKIAKIRLLAVLFIAVKLHLRKELANEEIKSLVTEKQYLELKNVSHMPLRIIKWMGDYLKKMYDRNYINSIQLTAYNQLLEELVGFVTGCERILNTPLPPAYNIHLKHLLLISLVIVPFTLLENLGWLTIPAMGIITFALLGIEAIGLEIENPFGYDANDLPLDKFNNVLHSNLEELMMSDSPKEY